MSSKKSNTASNMSKENAEHIVQIRAKDMSLSREKKPSKCGCCGKKYLSLGIVGFALLAVGSLLVMAHFSIRKITTSITLTQNTFPCYITGGVMAANGLLCMIMSKKRPRGLVILSVMSTIASCLLCFAGAVFSLTYVAPMLASFDKCQYFPIEVSCRCFYTSDLRQVSYIFRGTNNCKVVQFDLKNMVYGISGVYGAGLALCLVAGVMECLLMCNNRRSKRLSCRSRYEGDGKTASTSRQSQTSQTNLTLSCSEAELIAAASSSSTHASTSNASNTQTRRESQTRHESQTACARQHTCSHYVVDLDPVPRRDYCINYNNASSRHDPPPPYTE